MDDRRRRRGRGSWSRLHIANRESLEIVTVFRVCCIPWACTTYWNARQAFNVNVARLLACFFGEIDRVQNRVINPREVGTKMNNLICFVSCVHGQADGYWQDGDGGEDATVTA